jgi:hypothetical protein
MLKDLTVVAPDRPGTLAELADAIGRAGINIEGVAGYSAEGQGVIHLLVEDARAARQIVESLGLEVMEERDVLVVDTEDRPGGLAAVTMRVAATGVNLDFLYGIRSRLVMGADDIDKAERAL